MSTSRRRFLGAAGALAAGALSPQILWARSGMASRLVVVILRGALDGLSAVPATGDPHFASLRRDLVIPPPGTRGGALPLNSLFGLHPAMPFLHERYLARELLVVHALASAYRERSHFDGQNVLENGLTRPLGSAEGWLNRALSVLPPAAARAPAAGLPGRALAVSQNVPLILRGSQEVLSKSPQVTPDIDEDLLARLADLYSHEDWFSARLSEAVQSEKLGQDGENTLMSASVDKSERGNARLIKAAQLAAAVLRIDEGPEIAVFEAPGWDTHANQGAARGTLANRLGGLDQAMRALADGLGPHWPRTAVLIVTEFGRTAAMNGTRGTDHGTATCGFLLGGAVAGGRVISDWPGLGPADLFQGRDLKPTLDLRALSKGLLADHLKIRAADLQRVVFPDSDGVKPLKDLIKA